MPARMRSSKRRDFCAGIALAFLTLLIVLPASFGWGENADRLIADKAIATLPDEMLPFFQANRQFILQHVTDPAQSEAKNPSELRYDFIEIDHYGVFPFASLPRVYKDAVTKYGPAHHRNTRTASLADRRLQSKADRCVRAHVIGKMQNYRRRSWPTMWLRRTTPSTLR